MTALEGAIRRIVSDARAAAAVAWRPLDAEPGSGEELLIDEHARFEAASTMEIAVLIELHRQAAAHRINLEDTLVASGTTLRRLCEAMIATSSPVATNHLVDVVGISNIQRTLEAIGAEGMRVLRGAENGSASGGDPANTTDAMALLTLFWKLGRGEIVSDTASLEMIDLLERHQDRDGIPAGVPGGTLVAHKSATTTGTHHHHHAGIVYAPRPFAMVVLTRGVARRTDSARLIAAITRALYR